MNKCDCYHTEEQIIGWHTPVDPKTTIVHKCNGTKERDECSCGGDRTKCDFYPEVREKALPKFGEWISVEDRLPDNDKYVLCWYEYRAMSGTHEDEMIQKYGIGYYFKGWGGEVGCGCDVRVIAWMPLPTPPIE